MHFCRYCALLLYGNAVAIDTSSTVLPYACPDVKPMLGEDRSMKQAYSKPEFRKRDVLASVAAGQAPASPQVNK
jgi:hypothetical protein